MLFPGPPVRPLGPTAEASAVGWVSEWFQRYNAEPLASNPSGPSAVAQAFAAVDAFIEKTGHPVYLGEFGVIDQVDEQSRENYLRWVRGEAERRDIAWSIWDDGGGFKAMDVYAGSWVPALEKALLVEN